MQDSISRSLKIELPKRQSAFLWGPRQTGKSTLLKSSFPHSVYIDLLDFDEMDRFNARPTALGESLSALSADNLSHPIIIDEIQQVPALLNEVHRLIESEGLSFILCGSSARKLKRPGVNLLGGRAWKYDLFPLTIPEIPDFDLLRALNFGLLPRLYVQADERNLDAYLSTYLETEIYNEAYVRNVQAFSRFFKALKYCHGELLNFSAVARDCGVSSHTVQSYFNILEDTLVGCLVYPFRKRSTRQTISSMPKFYLFDVGLAGRICGRWIRDPSGGEFGKAFEHLMLMEIRAARSYLGRAFEMEFWRTKSGLEVDFVLGSGEVAIQVKSRIRSGDLRGLNAYVSEFKPKRAIAVTAENDSRILGQIEVVPYMEFIDRLYSGDLI